MCGSAERAAQRARRMAWAVSAASSSVSEPVLVPAQAPSEDATASKSGRSDPAAHSAATTPIRMCSSDRVPRSEEAAHARSGSHETSEDAGQRGRTSDPRPAMPAPKIEPSASAATVTSFVDTRWRSVAPRPCLAQSLPYNRAWVSLWPRIRIIRGCSSVTTRAERMAANPTPRASAPRHALPGLAPRNGETAPLCERATLRLRSRRQLWRLHPSASGWASRAEPPARQRTCGRTPRLVPRLRAWPGRFPTAGSNVAEL